jgi:hypothetical protein
MRAIYVPIADHSLDRLTELAREERRRPKDQAALLLEQAITAKARKRGTATGRRGASRGSR